MILTNCFFRIGKDDYYEDGSYDKKGSPKGKGHPKDKGGYEEEYDDKGGYDEGYNKAKGGKIKGKQLLVI